MATGFLLTRQQYDRNNACVFELWLKTDKGPTKLIIDGERPVCFIKSEDMPLLGKLLETASLSVTATALPLRSFSNEAMTALYSHSIKDYQGLRNLTANSQLVLLEEDIKPVDRYLMERFITGGVTFIGQASYQAPPQTYRQVKIKPSEYEVELSHLSIDIECDERGKLYSIGFYAWNESSKEEFSLVLYNLQWVEAEIEEARDYIEWCKDERDLLRRFCQVIQQRDPDLLIGWNFIGFDIKVLVAAAERLGVALTLGRDGSKIRFSDGTRQGEQRYPDKVYIAGRVALDGIEVMRNATYQFSSFSLNNVASELLGESKLINADTTSNKLAEIKHQYKYQPLQLAEYNLQDCKLVSKIFNQEKLVEYLITRTKLTGLELDRVGGSVAAFTNLYLPHVHRKGWIAPNLVAPEDYVHSPGGFVMDSQPGIHSDVLVFDFKSLYPSIIRTFNVDPIGLLEARTLEEEQTIEGFRGGRFSREPGTLAKILDRLWTAREQAKQQNNKVFSNAIKIIMNSFYGVLGSSGCRFYDTKLASSITMRGHWILNQSKLWFEQAGLNVIYGDTDSIFVSLDGSDKTRKDAEALEHGLNQWWQQKLKDEFNLDCKLEMEFETHFSPFFMPTIRGSESGSKKRYAGMKRQGEEKELVFKGLESVRSDWTELAKQFQTELYTRVFDGLDCASYIDEITTDLKSGKLDDLLIYRKRIRQRLESYTKTTPPHIKAARKANAELDRNVYRKGSTIEYVISTTGPVVAGSQQYYLDYQHYLDKQLMPIAESILRVVSPELASAFEQQMTLL